MPWDYALMNYRRDMGIGWFEAVTMPKQVIERDIAFQNFEAIERPKLHEPPAPEQSDLPPASPLG